MRMQSAFSVPIPGNPLAQNLIVMDATPPQVSESADDTTLLYALLPNAELYVPSLIAAYFEVDEDTITRHARMRPARFVKQGGRWQWETREAAAKFCAYLLAVCPKARRKFKNLRKEFGKSSDSLIHS